jgi:Crp-like helix-turn-helix protein
MINCFNSSEKPLARAFLSLAGFEKKDRPEEVIPDVSQETLAEMFGTTRSRVKFFKNKFRKLGFITNQIFRSEATTRFPVDVARRAHLSLRCG